MGLVSLLFISRARNQ